MTPPFHLADSGEAADLAAFLGRLLHYDKRAVVRLQARGRTLAVFGRPPFDVLAVRTARLAVEGAFERESDATVSAGQFLDGLDDATAVAAVPPTVTGPSWAGLLPPRGGWRRSAVLAPEGVRREVALGIAEFRARSEGLAPDARTRAELDRIAADIWSRPLALPGAAGLPLRAVHAAHALGFVRPVRVPEGPPGAYGPSDRAAVPAPTRSRGPGPEPGPGREGGPAGPEPGPAAGRGPVPAQGSPAGGSPVVRGTVADRSCGGGDVGGDGGGGGNGGGDGRHRYGHGHPDRGQDRGHGDEDGIAVFSSGGWLRVRTAYGSIAVRRASGLGLTVTPVS